MKFLFNVLKSESNSGQKLHKNVCKKLHAENLYAIRVYKQGTIA